MRNSRRALFGLSLLVLGTGLIRAQDGAPADPRGLTVTATASVQGIRFIAVGEAARMRLEIYSAAGDRVYDSDYKPGSVLDWSRSEGQASLSSEEVYLLVVTVEDLSGRFRRKTGAVSLQTGRVALLPVGSAPLTSSLAAVLETSPSPDTLTSSEGDDGLTILGESTTPALTVTGHDGQQGKLTSTGGALTFRIGDLFAGEDVERMRITPEGRVGIGVDDPQATLDVAGEIRARGGIRLDDGTLLTSSDGTLSRTAADGSVVAAVAGGGTQDRVAKWTDSSGTLGDSAIAEVGGRVGIGTTNPGAPLHIYGSALQDVFAGMGPNPNAGPGFNYGYAGFSFGRSAGFFNIRPDAAATPPNPSLRFMTANAQQMIITNTGNVGVGTNFSAPTYKLHVVNDFGGGLRVQTDGADQIVASFGGYGEFQVDKAETTAGRFVVTHEGNVGIGVPAPTATLEVKVGGTTLADAWNIRSSARFKTNIQAIPSALDRVLQLRGVTFDWKETGRRSVGFIAEEVGQVLPEAVEYEANGHDAKGLDYGKLTPLLVEAVKEQQKIIAEMQRQNAELQARLAAQEAWRAAVEEKLEANAASAELTPRPARPAADSGVRLVANP